MCSHGCGNGLVDDGREDASSVANVGYLIPIDLGNIGHERSTVLNHERPVRFSIDIISIIVLLRRLSGGT